tara:strand:- start:593 stop:1471 length:879 start_codon:yes stop_codon:yes gene_type:complete
MRFRHPNLVTIPWFMLEGLKNRKLSFFHKIYLIIKGKSVSLLFDRLNGTLFCYFINIFFKNDGKIYFDGNFYYKKLNDGQKVFYPNKRIDRVLINAASHFESVLSSYSLHLVDFKDNDLVLDCGANIGEINLALKKKKIFVDYFAFEPDSLTYECCLLNNKESKENIKNIGLGDESGQKEFFIDTYGGNSSVVFFGEEKKININIEKLDNLKINKKIKLLKIDAEGYEPEVLKGAKETLKNVEYLAVDFGPERGEDQEDTIIEVNNFLTKNNFSLIKFEINRITGLYKNKQS